MPTDLTDYLRLIGVAGVGSPGVPDVPTLPNVKAGQMPDNLASVTSTVNSLNIAGQQAANNARVPGAANLEQQSSNVIGSLLKGQIPSDVLYTLGEGAAERGVGRGFPGSPNEMASYLRGLGLTSLDMIKQGQDYLTQADARNPGAKTLDTSTMVLTPAQAAQINAQIGQTNIDAILKQGALATQQWQAGLEDATKRMAIEKGQYSPQPWWSSTNPKSPNYNYVWNDTYDPIP